MARSRLGDLLRPLQAPPDVHEVPAGIADHVLAGQPGQRQHSRQHRGLGRSQHHPAVAPRFGEFGDGAVGGAEHHPGVAGQLVAHRPGGFTQPVERLGHRAGLDGVEHQLPDPLQWLETRREAPCPRHLGDRVQQHRDAAGPEMLWAETEVVHPLAGDDQQPGQILGAFGVPAEPEHVFEHPRGRAGLQRIRLHQRTLVQPGAALPPIRRIGPAGTDPDVLGNAAATATGHREFGILYPAERAGHRDVAGTVGHREQPHADLAGDQAARGSHRCLTERGHLLTDPAGRFGRQPDPPVLPFRVRHPCREHRFPAAGRPQHHVVEIGQHV